MARWRTSRLPLAVVLLVIIGFPIARYIYGAATGPSPAEKQWQARAKSFFDATAQTVADVELWGSNPDDVSSAAFRPTFNAALAGLSSCGGALTKVGPPPTAQLQRVRNDARAACRHYQDASKALRIAFSDVDAGQTAAGPFATATADLNKGDTLLERSRTKLP